MMFFRKQFVCLLAVLSAALGVAQHRKPVTAHARTPHKAATKSSVVKSKSSSARKTAKKPTAAAVRVSAQARAEALAFVTDLMRTGSSALTFPKALEPFYAALRAHEDESTTTIRVLQFGDSHTAADMFTGEARQVMQQRFGNGGIGFSYAGHPFAGYRILGSQRSQSNGWTTQGNHFTNLGDGRTGMGGLSIQTSRPNEFVTLDAPCTTLQVDYLLQPGGGTLRFDDNGAYSEEISTSLPEGAATDAGSFRYPCPAGDHHFTLTTTSSNPVRLLGMTATQPGATWESIGINGAEAPLMLKWNPDLFTEYLRQTGASLIVLAYGTNEAAAHWTKEEYSATLARLVDLLHETAPDASILVLGPADRSIRERRKPFHPFAGTGRIIEAQREVCSAHNCAFWNWSQRMGGLGSMQQWATAGWAQADHTHFTGEGYRTLADALLADLLSGYDAYRTNQLQ